MGADIHGVWVMRREYPPESKGGESWDKVAVIDGMRNYLAFGLLAGVRQRTDDEPLVPTRGYPTEDGYRPWHDHGPDWGCHSASWATTAEVRAVRDRYLEVSAAAGYGEWRPLWLDLLVLVMEHVESQGAPARAVYCFDN